MNANVSFRTHLGRILPVPLLLALFQLVLLMAFHGRYDYFRDELYYIACSDHLAFGFVDQPPLCAVILWMSRHVLGDSLHAIRFLPALSGAVVVYLAALMARKLGGGSFAQGLAAFSVIAAPVLLGQDKFFTMNSFDVLFWALAAYVLFLILHDDDQKLWIPFGGIVGLGLLNKYSIGFMVIGLVAGLVLTPQRRHLLTKWFWLGALLATVLFLPHVIWQIMNGFPSLEFMRNASQNKNVSLGVVAFFAGQLLELNPVNAPLWFAGIVFFFFFRDGTLRPLSWMYPLVFIIMVVGNAKIYYLAPIYPPFLAGGCVVFERWFNNLRWRWPRYAYVTTLSLFTLIGLPFAVPILTVEQFIDYERMIGITPKADERTTLAELPQYYADQFGWEEMVALVADAYKKLTPEEQSECVIYVRNYGEAAAIDFFGGRYGLPKAICGHNNYWLWGPGTRSGNVAIIFGDSRDLQRSLDDLQRAYSSVELSGTTNARYAMPFENGRLIFICKGMKTTFQKIWDRERFYI